MHYTTFELTAGRLKNLFAIMFIEENDTRGIRTDLVDRIRKILAVLIVAENMDHVKGPPGWRIHQLSGDRRGTWSLSVSGNWRITFDVEHSEIHNLGAIKKLFPALVWPLMG